VVIRFAQDTDVKQKQIAEVHVASSKAAYHGLIPDPALSQLTVSKRETAWKEIFDNGKTLTLVLEIEGMIVGFADVGKLVMLTKTRHRPARLSPFIFWMSIGGKDSGENCLPAL